MSQVESPPGLHGSHLLHPMADCAHLVDHALVDKQTTLGGLCVRTPDSQIVQVLPGVTPRCRLRCTPIR